MSEDYNNWRKQLEAQFHAPAAPIAPAEETKGLDQSGALLPAGGMLAEYTPPTAGSASTGATKERTAPDTGRLYGEHNSLVASILYLHGCNEDKCEQKNKSGTRNVDRKWAQCLANLFFVQGHLTRKQLALALEPEYHWESIIDPITKETLNYRSEPTGRTRIQRYAKQLIAAGIISSANDLHL